MALISISDIQNLDPATPDLFNSRYNLIVDEVNGSLSADNLANDAITAPKLATDSVTTGKIAAAAVTPPKWTNPYKFSVYRNAPYTTGSVLPCDTALFDTGNNVDLVTNKGRFTAPIAGFYFFTGVFHVDLPGGNGIAGSLYKNGGTQIITGFEGVQGAVGLFGFQAVASGLFQLAAGDYVEFTTFGSGVAGTTGSANNGFMGFLVSAT